MKNKVVIITGASSGIGKATAILFAKSGALTVVAARNYEKLTSIADELIKEGCTVLPVKTDVQKEDDCRNLIQQTLAHFHKIDVLINNAGISMRAIFEEVDLSVIKKVMDVNFYGTVYCTKYAIPYLLKSQGSIIGISSIAGFKGLPGRTAYSASKFAMHGFLEAIRLENLEKGLHVLLACPGFTASNIRNTALGSNGEPQGESPRKEQKMMQAEEVAIKLFKAIQNKQNTLILTTNSKLTVWLNKFFPKWVDRLVFNHMRKEPKSPF